MLTPIEYRPMYILCIGPHFGAVFEWQKPVLGQIGAELTLNRHRHSPDFKETTWIWGGFLQVGAVGLERARVAFGPQLSYSVLGAEIGPVLETNTETRAAHTGLHIAPYASLGIVSFSVQVDIPILSLSEGQRPGVSVGLTGTLKIPMPLSEGRL